MARAKTLGWVRAGELGTLVGGDGHEELLQELEAGSLEPVEGEVGVLPKNSFFVTCDDRAAGAPARLVRPWKKGAEGEW